MINLQDTSTAVIAIAKKAGQFLLSQIQEIASKDIEEKGIHNLVTHVDKATEKMLVEDLSALLPEAGFIAEEGTSDKKGELYQWIIDPLDGTTNYIHQVPLFSVSIALQRGQDIVLGVIYEPNLNECFYSWEGAPSYLNGKEIHVSDNRVLDNALLATGFPYYDYGQLEAYLQLFKHLMQHSRGVRRLGSAAVDLAYTACGRYDAFYEYGLSPWDVAAGTLIVQNAGGLNMNFAGGKEAIFGKEIISGNKAISTELQALVRDFFMA